jgi:hypothetical protein
VLAWPQCAKISRSSLAGVCGSVGQGSVVLSVGILRSGAPTFFGLLRQDRQAPLWRRSWPRWLALADLPSGCLGRSLGMGGEVALIEVGIGCMTPLIEAGRDGWLGNGDLRSARVGRRPLGQGSIRIRGACGIAPVRKCGLGPLRSEERKAFSGCRGVVLL